MAIDFEATAGNQYYENIGDSAVSDYPATLVAWIKPESQHFGEVLQLQAGSPDDRFRLVTFNDDTIHARRTDDPAETDAISPATVTSGSYSHVAGVFISSTSCFAYADGVAGTEDTTSSSPTALDEIRFGGLSSDFDGFIAEAAVYSAALSAAEIAALAKGYSPLLIRPQSLVHYWYAFAATDPLVDVIGNANLTQSGSPVTADHPPILYPTRPIIPASSPVFTQSAFRVRNDDGGLGPV